MGVCRAAIFHCQIRFHFVLRGEYRNVATALRSVLFPLLEVKPGINDVVSFQLSLGVNIRREFQVIGQLRS